MIEDLFAYREELLEALPHGDGRKFKIGLPRAMSMLDRLPFWKRYFAELGMETVLSPVTDPRISAGGIELSVARALLSGAGGARPRAGADRARAWTTSGCR